MGLLEQFEKLDFSGRGEAFVESMYLIPLLLCLGYEAHKDYEVIHHGDDGSSFKLRYPPVEKGAVKVKHYNPDYIPTIRKKAFWIIEAKSPKNVKYPFEPQYLVQGLQYCIHPEIQAKYLLVSTGAFSAVYDAHGSVFLGKDIYEPILEFRSTHLTKRWPAIYELLSVEKLRSRIEADLRAMYDKLALSSLDKRYPAELLKKIGASEREHSKQIEKHVVRLHVESMDRDRTAWRQEMEELDPAAIFERMDRPLPSGGSEAQYFVKKSLTEGRQPQAILRQLTHDFDQQCIFRKQQTFVAVCLLHQLTDDGAAKTAARAFLDQYKDADLPLLNQTECAALRLLRKATVVSLYPALREIIRKKLQFAPELTRFVRPPTAFDLSYASELEFHWNTFQKLKTLSVSELRQVLDGLLSAEASIEEDFKKACSKLSDGERQIGGFEHYGVDGKHYAFRNIMHNLNVERRPDLTNPR